MSLADARAKAKELLAQVVQGIDPAAEKRAAKEAVTVGELAVEYIERHAKPKKRSWKADERMLATYVPKGWQHAPAASITRRQVRDVLDAIAARAPIQANRVLALLRKVWNFGIKRDLVETNPCAILDRPAPEHQRDRVLTAEEIRQVWNALDGEDPQTAALFRLYLLTAQRGGELKMMRWDDLDLDAGWWTVPAEHAKNNLAHRVPLSQPAVALLRGLREQANGSVWVFPSTSASGHRAVLHKTTERVRERSGVDFVSHDLRRTVATFLTGELNVSRLVVSKLLNHVESGVTRVYDRSSYDTDKRRALDAWARHLTAILTKRAKRRSWPCAPSPPPRSRAPSPRPALSRPPDRPRPHGRGYSRGHRGPILGWVGAFYRTEAS